ncbi:MAG: AIR synthase-related protein [bacterium]
MCAGKRTRDACVEGKLPLKILSRLLARLSKPGREVLVGPRIGEDAFAVSVGRAVVVGTTDPITFTQSHIGYYAVNVNANDVATMGAAPRWFLATVLVPPRAGARAVGTILDEIDTTCVSLGARLLGGHTEATCAVTRPVVVGAMLGTVPARGLIDSRNVWAGDVLLMTKRLAIEGTAIVAQERRQEVERLLGRRQAARARALLFRPGISIVREALCAAGAAPVHGMHDPTEGGMLWGLRELSLAAGMGVEVDVDAIPIYEETRALCEHFGLNPLGLIASGTLLLAVPARHSARVAASIERLGIECTAIGRFGGRGVRARRRAATGRRADRLADLKADEITKIVRSVLDRQ